MRLIQMMSLLCCLSYCRDSNNEGRQTTASAVDSNQILTNDTALEQAQADLEAANEQVKIA